MHRYLSSIRHGRRGSSLIISLLASPKTSLPSFGALPLNHGHVRGFSSASWGLSGRIPSENVDANVSARPNWRNPSENVNANVSARPNWRNPSENVNASASSPRSWRNPSENVNANASAFPNFMWDRENTNSRSENNAEIGGNFRHMDYVRGAIEEDEKGAMLGSPYSRYHYEQDADFVHIKMLRNNTFVTVTDPKGNVKLSGSAGSTGSLKDMKSGQKLSRYAAEATAEVVGRRARGLGLKSVVMKVKGFTHFRRKRQAILSWREGFTDSKGDKNPIVFIEDTTRRPHNGCRLPKKRRI